MTAKNINGPSVEGDRYYTPEWCVDQCLDLVVPEFVEQLPGTLLSALFPELGRVLEPGAGRGAFIRGVRKRYPAARITGVDNDPDVWQAMLAAGATETNIGDYLSPEMKRWLLADGEFDLAIGNPPFTLALEFITRSLEVAKAVVFLLRQGFLSSAKRAAFFRQHKPAKVHLLANRPAFDTPAGPATGTDTADYCFVTWLRGYTGPTELVWLPEVPASVRRPGGKP